MVTNAPAKNWSQPDLERNRRLVGEALERPADQVTQRLADLPIDDEAIRAETITPRMRNGLDRLQAGLSVGHFDPQSIDLDEIGNAWASKSPAFNDGWRDIQRAIRTGTPLTRAEGLFDGVDKSQFGELAIMCGATQFLDRCDAGGFDDIINCVGERRMGPCDDRRLRTPIMIDDINFGCPSPSDSERRMTGTNSPLFSKLPAPKEYKMGIGLKANLNCNGVMDLVRDVWANESRVPYDRKIARETIALILGGCCSKGPCGFTRMNLDGNNYDIYEDNEDTGRCNVVYQAEDLSYCGTEALLSRIEDRMEKAKDPWTGDFIDCCNGSWDVISFGSQSATKKMMIGLAAHQIEAKGADGDCTETMRFQRAGRARFGTIKQGPNFQRFACEHFTACYGPGTNSDFTADEIKQMVNRSYVIGCTSRSFKRIVDTEFTRSQYGGTDTWAYFNQGVQEFHGIDFSYGWMVEPMIQIGGATLLVQGLPDGKLPADLVC